MKCVITREKLQNLITQSERAVSKSASLPVLESILVMAKQGMITVRSTDLELGIEASTVAVVENEGSVLVDGNTLSRIVGALSGDSVALEVHSNMLHIKTDTSRMEIKTQDDEDFPTLPQIPNATPFDIPTSALIEGLSSVAFAAAIPDIKPEIASVYLYSEGDQLVFVATDSFRLAEKRIRARDIEEFPGILIPVKNTREIIKVLGHYAGESKLYIDDNQIAITGEGLYLTSRVINGTFPDYRRIIPTQKNTTAVILSQDLDQVLKLSQLFSDNYKQLDVHIDPVKPIFTVKAENTKVGSHVTEIIGALSGDKVDLRVNFGYLADVFQTMKTDSVELAVQEPTKPLVVTGIGDESFLYLVMPMNRS